MEAAKPILSSSNEDLHEHARALQVKYGPLENFGKDGCMTLELTRHERKKLMKLNGKLDEYLNEYPGWNFAEVLDLYDDLLTQL